MFLHLSVILSTGGVCVSQLPTPPEVTYPPPKVTYTSQKSPTSPWKSPTPPPREMATEAGGTHHTGMHTC